MEWTDLKKAPFILPVIIILWLPDRSLYAANTEPDTSVSGDGFHIGGALRFNLVSEFYGGNHTTLDTYVTSDTWRLNVTGNMRGIDLSFEYRFYPTFGTHFIHHGYFGFNLARDLYASLGVSQVPFGVTGFASHSWWFQGPYYVGLEDDYDIGIKFDYTGIPDWEFFLAYYRESEPEGPSFGGEVSFGQAGPGRYSYDITSSRDRTISDTTVSIRELNHLHFRATRTFLTGITAGVSGQVGQVYNRALNGFDISTAFAVHMNADIGQWNFKGQWIYYHYNGRDDAGNTLELIPLGAYGFRYFVADESFLYVAGLSYTFDIDLGPLEYIEVYTDYTLFDKVNPSFYSTHHLVPGFLVKIASIYLYVDLAVGKNHPWLTDNFGTGLDAGNSEAPWNKRLNINIGYYF